MSEVPCPKITLIEVYADRAAGHWGDNLVRLCEGAVGAGRAVTVISVRGIHPYIRTGLQPTGVQVVDRPVGNSAAACLWVSRKLRPVRSLIVRLAPQSQLDAQVGYVAKCLAEVSALRTAIRVSGPGNVTGPLVILDACQALTVTAARLSRAPHVRFVHGLGIPEGRLVRGVERLSRRRAEMVRVVCSTGQVEGGLRRRHPELRTSVRTYTTTDPRMYIAPEERAPRRAELGIGDDEFVVSMVGGWWEYKDIDMVERALWQLTHPVTLIVAGNPIRPAELQSAISSSGGRIVDLAGAVTEPQLRRIYAASDCSVVTRVSGFDKEAATSYDAARYGVPLIMTDHDPARSRLLMEEPWVRLFPPGDEKSLAHLLDEAFASPLPRPDRHAPARLGLSRPDEAIEAFCKIAADLPNW